MAAALRPRDHVRLADVGDGRAVPIGRVSGPDLAALLANDLDRQPAARSLDMADSKVDVADPIGPVQGELDVRIHSTGRVQFADPVELGLDAERLEGPKEDLADEMAGVVGGAAALGRGHARERGAHVAIDRVGRQLGLGVHGVHVVDAVEERGRQPRAQQRAMDRVVEHDAAQ